MHCLGWVDVSFSEHLSASCMNLIISGWNSQCSNRWGGWCPDPPPASTAWWEKLAHCCHSCRPHLRHLETPAYWHLVTSQQENQTYENVFIGKVQFPRLVHVSELSVTDNPRFVSLVPSQLDFSCLLFSFLAGYLLSLLFACHHPTECAHRRSMSAYTEYKLTHPWPPSDNPKSPTIHWSHKKTQ